MITAKCDSCGTQYRVQDGLCGKKFQCKKCGSAVVIPGSTVPHAAPVRSVPMGSDKEIIRYACPKCSGKLENPGTMGGRDDKCPMCGFVHPVPLSKSQRKEYERQQALQQQALAEMTLDSPHQGSRVTGQVPGDAMAGLTDAAATAPPPLNVPLNARVGTGTRKIVWSVVGGIGVLAAVTAVVFLLRVGGRHEDDSGTSERSSARNSGAKDSPKVTRKVNLTGNAWLALKSGKSDIIRGLKVYVLKETLENSPEVWSPLLSDLREAIDRFKRYEEREGMREVAERQGRHARELISKIEETSRLRRVAAPVAIQLIRNANVLASDGQYARTTGQHVQQDESWAKLAATGLVESANTDVGGKYEIECEVGDICYLYAIHETSVEVVEWFVRVKTSKSGTVKTDLFNENVFRSYSTTKEH